MTPSAPALGRPGLRLACGLATSHGITARLAEQFDTESPGDATDLTTGVHDCLAAAARVLAEPGPRSASGLSDLVGRAGEWAREGVDLDTVLRAYHQAVRRGFEHLTGDRSAAEDLLAYTDQVLRLLETVSVVTAAAYLDEHRLAARHHQTAAQTLVSTLLSGRGRAVLSRRTGISVAATYQVVALGIPATPKQRSARIDTEAVARRTLRRVQSELAPVLGSRALSLLSAEGGTLLVPVEESATGKPGAAHIGAPAFTSETLDVLSAAAGVGLTATVVTGPTSDIPELAEQAHELLELVTALDRGPGLYRMADVALEYQMMRPGPAREHLAGLLAPLASCPELLETLRVYLDTGLDRKVTARRLDLHPNSISHRIRRIERTADVDLSHPVGISRVSLALLAHDLGATTARTEEHA